MNELEALMAELTLLRHALDRIITLGNDWSANQLGTKTIHERRWKMMLAIAQSAMTTDSDTRANHS